MKTSDFFYELPQGLIAQTPLSRRDNSRLMVCQRGGADIVHRRFYDIKDYLRAGDVLVINTTRVMPSRLLGRLSSGAQVELLLLKRRADGLCECMARPGKKLRPGTVIEFGGLTARIAGVLDGGLRLAQFDCDGEFYEALDRAGVMPLPPYIHEKLNDNERYQTVYSDEMGSAAAPTAGLHFTPELIDELKAMGVIFAPVLLHVGLGTFRPVKVSDILSHQMHSEYYEISAESTDIINHAKKEGRRVICVGTTCVRTLESAFDGRAVAAGSANTEIFIYPGYEFNVVDALITNFHLPESTLIMLVSAFYGHDNTMAAYRAAVREGYRFFSFGDAMMIL